MKFHLWSLLLLLFVVPIVHADVNEFSFSAIHLEPDSISAFYTIDRGYIWNEFPEEDVRTIPNFEPYLRENVLISNDALPCKGELQKVVPQPGVLNRYEYEYSCPSPINLVSFEYNMFFNGSGYHKNVVTFHLAGRSSPRTLDHKNRVTSIAAGPLFVKYGVVSDDEEEVAETVATSANEPDQGEPSEAVEDPFAEKTWLALMIQFVVSGIEHILIGYDHILFLFGLLLVTLRFKDLLIVVTSFTVAHSITLIAAALDLFSLNIVFVESMIALSIVYIAVENYFITKGSKSFFGNTKHRWKITFAFGLIHGFGFASVLRAFGLPEDGLLLALLSFNVGVELGQLMIVAVVLPLLWWSAKYKWHNYVVLGGSGIIGLLGLFWFVQRVTGM